MDKQRFEDKLIELLVKKQEQGGRRNPISLLTTYVFGLFLAWFWAENPEHVQGPLQASFLAT
jgi:hypothetical protein